MRSVDDQMEQVRRRASALRARKRRRVDTALVGFSGVGSLCLIVLVANALSGTGLLTASSSAMTVLDRSGTIVVNGSVAGFAIIIALSFALGVCVTLLATRLKSSACERLEEHPQTADDADVHGAGESGACDSDASAHGFGGLGSKDDEASADDASRENG